MLGRRTLIDRYWDGALRGRRAVSARLAAALMVTEAHVAALPRQVRVLIRIREDLSERLIGRLQFVVLAWIAAFYWGAPRPADAPAAALHDPVPITLALFAAFTTVRVVLAERRRVPVWFLFVSIVVEIGLLVGLIWSFHIHYGQQPPFSLRVPTFVYFFVFIALRALCFDYRLVVAAGVAAMLG